MPKFEACKECQKRQVGCHSACHAYLAFAEQNEKIRRERKKRLLASDDSYSARFGKLKK